MGTIFSRSTPNLLPQSRAQSTSNPTSKSRDADVNLDFGPAFVGPLGKGLAGGWGAEDEEESSEVQQNQIDSMLGWKAKIGQSFGDTDAGRVKCLYDQTPQKPTTTLQSHFHLRRNTLKLVRTSSNTATLSFQLDTTVPCVIRINVPAHSPYSCIPNRDTHVKPGLDQSLSIQFGMPAESGEDVTMVLVVENDADSEDDRQTQITFLTVMHQKERREEEEGEEEGGGVAEVRVIRQDVVINSITYTLQEIYGLSSISQSAPQDASSMDCVICLSEPKDVVVVPCRHFCLCIGCAEAVRMQGRSSDRGVGVPRCPICRTIVQSLLRIKLPEIYRPNTAMSQTLSRSRSRPSTARPTIQPSSPPLPAAPLASVTAPPLEPTALTSPPPLDASQSDLQHIQELPRRKSDIDVHIIPGAVPIEEDLDDIEMGVMNTEKGWRDCT
ncbi:uncharacterized protein SPPG_07720 [Spizellomyces punctatus DAOM BR117]|uniref:RING-type domain-containing protein n=1 Tax=Spizellomyces punctatus (strain DAOM BR117) TaxID=645134 RepID=A0A0L0H6N0_SPIPD|nr:uncharacterized protein SPPG_07720 [Spizellomyces punctatus DAOM BR117]KNC96892.1 hypothetical protein SPPG_07720 [Spizellomyces punctatus DAOM BR117]|eukprot:XP_016604932.1 hypothetical protein SPPG_07720 [Spizellomyces punctatus DAOM BR117]